MRASIAVACAGLALAYGGAAAADGGSGTYTATGQTYDFDLFNSGTAPWQYFYLVAPSGMRFIGGATAGESTAHCVVGQPNGQANEIECGPLSSNVLPPNTHALFVATLSAPGACGAPFQLDISSPEDSPFTRVGDVTYAGNCAAAPPRVVEPPALHGTPTAGRTLTATAPTWSATPTRVTYQWQLCTMASCSPIQGATKLTLTLTGRDTGRSVRIVATATVDGARVQSASKQIAIRARR